MFIFEYSSLKFRGCRATQSSDQLPENLLQIYREFRSIRCVEINLLWIIPLAHHTCSYTMLYITCFIVEPRAPSEIGDWLSKALCKHREGDRPSPKQFTFYYSTGLILLLLNWLTSTEFTPDTLFICVGANQVHSVYAKMAAILIYCICTSV